MNVPSILIGLFGLLGILGVVVVPIMGRVIDRMAPWNIALVSTLSYRLSSCPDGSWRDQRRCSDCCLLWSRCSASDPADFSRDAYLRVSLGVFFDVLRKYVHTGI